MTAVHLLHTRRTTNASADHQCIGKSDRGTGAMSVPASTDTPPAPKRRFSTSPLASRRVLFGTLILFLESFPQSMLMGQYLVLLTRDLGGRVFAVTSLTGLMGAMVGVVSTVHLGTVSQPENAGRRAVLMFATLVGTLSTVALLADNGFILALVDLIIIGLGCRFPCGVYSVLCAWISDWAEPSATSMVIATVNSGFTCGILLGTLVGGYLLDSGLVTLPQLIWTSICLKALAVVVMYYGTSAAPPKTHVSVPATGRGATYTNTDVDNTNEYLMVDLEDSICLASCSEFDALSPASDASTVDATPLRYYYESRNAGATTDLKTSAANTHRFSFRSHGDHTGSDHTGSERTGGERTGTQKESVFELMRRSQAVFTALFKLSPGVMIVSSMHFLNQQTTVNSTYLYYASALKFTAKDLNFNVFIGASLSVILNATAAPFMALTSFTGMTALFGCLCEATQNLIITFSSSKGMTFIATAVSATGCLIQPVMMGYIIKRTNDVLKSRSDVCTCTGTDTPAGRRGSAVGVSCGQCGVGPAAAVASQDTDQQYTEGASGGTAAANDSLATCCVSPAASLGSTTRRCSTVGIVDDATLQLLNQGAVVGGFSSLRSFTGAFGPVLAAALLQGYSILPWPFCFPTLAFAVLGIMMLVATCVVFVAFVLPAVRGDTTGTSANNARYKD